MSVIKVDGLSKKYIINHLQRERYTALRDVISNMMKSHWRNLTCSSSPSLEDFWALRDVSFDVKQGDRVGIIGRNGAGKSTLLKILSRITEPTSGRITLKGRVASLLEVGTGFHPELTGRENVFLNGAILGMSKAEIKKKFDEIVAFAEVEKFLDTPVKRYSSGMYVRLAFAVAAHLEPEILIVDEVLAVGDVQFQKKCLGRMKEVGREGRTVLFVSHNMAAIKTLCNKGICLNTGSILFSGTSSESIQYYLGNEYTNVSSNVIIFEKPQRGVLRKAEWLSCDNRILEENTPLKIAFEVEPHTDISANFEIVIRDQLGIPITFLSPGHFNGELITFRGGTKTIVELATDPLCLAAGFYAMDISLCEPNKECFGSTTGEITFEVPICDPNKHGFSYKASDNLGCWFIKHKTVVRETKIISDVDDWLLKFRL